MVSQGVIEVTISSQQALEKLHHVLVLTLVTTLVLGAFDHASFASYILPHKSRLSDLTVAVGAFFQRFV